MHASPGGHLAAKSESGISEGVADGYVAGNGTRAYVSDLSRSRIGSHDGRTASQLRVFRIGPGMTRVLAINGSYRDDGITDQIVETMARAVTAAGGEIEVVHLRSYPIEFCLNCRECTQQPGTTPGQCVHSDGMAALIARIESADAYILASPTNFGSVTAVFKRFMERLVVYAYWPWGTAIPKFRKAGLPPRKAVLVSSSAAPGILGRWMFSTQSQLKMAAKTIGASTVGTIFTGLIAKQRHIEIPDKLKAKATALANRLVRD